MNQKQRDELRAVCEGATDGPWFVHKRSSCAVMSAEDIVDERNVASCGGYQDGRESTYPQNQRNADFIATFDPPTVRGMLDYIEELENENEGMRNALRPDQ